MHAEVNQDYLQHNPHRRAPILNTVWYGLVLKTVEYWSVLNTVWYWSGLNTVWYGSVLNIVWYGSVLKTVEYGLVIDTLWYWSVLSTLGYGSVLSTVWWSSVQEWAANMPFLVWTSTLELRWSWYDADPHIQSVLIWCRYTYTVSDLLTETHILNVTFRDPNTLCR